MELTERPPRPRWTAFWFGCIAGAAPWIAIGGYLFGGGDAPAFVYAIFVSLFLAFNSCALNIALQDGPAARGAVGLPRKPSMAREASCRHATRSST